MTRQPSLFAPSSGLTKASAAAFERFWAAYPVRRPNPRALAEVEFGRAIRAGAEPDALVRAAGAYAAECKRLGIANDFIVHARTFLSQHRWRDYVAPEAPPQPHPPVEVPEDAHHPLAALRPRMTHHEWRTWMLPLGIVSQDGDERALLSAPTRFHASHVKAQHYVAIKQALRVRVLDILAQEDIHP